MFGFLKNLFKSRGSETAPETIAPPASAPPSTPLPSAPPAAPDAQEMMSLPLKSILAKLSQEMQSKVAKNPAANVTVAVPLKKIMAQMPSGSVKITFGELRQISPPGTFASAPDLDQNPVELPLHEIVARIAPDLLPRRQGQRKVEVPTDVTGLFDSKAKPGAAVRSAVVSAAPAEASAPPPQPKAPPPQPKAPTPPAPAPVPARPEAKPPAQPLRPPQPQIPGKPEAPKPAPFRPEPPKPQIFSAPPPPPPPVPPVPQAPPPEVSAPSAPTPISVSPALRELMAASAKSATPAPAPKQPLPPPAPPAPPAAPISSPAVSLPAGPAGTIAAQLSAIFEQWPEAVKAEIAQHDLQNAAVYLPGDEVGKGLRFGKVAFSWKQIRSWIIPPPAAPSSVGDTTLEMPLKVIAPLFMAHFRGPQPTKKAATGEGIPDMFGPKTPVAPAPAPVEPPAPPPPPAPPAPPVAPAPAARGNWQPQELAEMAASLPGVAGSVLATQDGLLVAAEMPSHYKKDTLAAFLPQIFGRMNQYAQELDLGDVSTLTFFAGGTPWHICKGGSVYLAVMGRAGDPLPVAEINALTEELARQNKK